MMSNSQAWLLTCGIFCIWPAMVGVLSVIGYKRYQDGGWRAVIFGDKHEQSL